MSVWLITGASRGLGAAIAREALDRGHTVVATSRDLSGFEEWDAPAPPNLVVLKLDVRDPAQVEAAVAETVARFGGIDVLVNNAGRGLRGAVEEVSDAEARAVFDINVFGLLQVTRAVLPGMRSRRSGRIVMMSSVGGVSVKAGSGVYGSTKFAVEGLSEALREEVAPLGIQVLLVEPSAFRTDFAVALGTAEARFDDYDATAGLVRGRRDTEPGDPVRAATAIADVIEEADPPFRLPLGVMAVQRIDAKIEALRADLDRSRRIAIEADSFE
jgi:NAD(P)-dependent dehydrogenase (short-subunit alcohol dehydrogenase family)